MIGHGRYAVLNLKQLEGKDNAYAYHNLVGAVACIGEENEPSMYMSQSAQFKAAVTGDDILVQMKYQRDRIYAFIGLFVQCVNEIFKNKEKNDSFYRRFLFVPFPKWFKQSENKDIKDVYLNRKDVLEYIAFKALNRPDIDFLPEPRACKELKGAFKAENDPVQRFLDCTLEHLVWDFYPYDILYEFYKEWYRRNNPSGSDNLINDGTFIKHVKRILIETENQCWEPTPSDGPGSQLDINKNCVGAEPLILHYGVVRWLNPGGKTGTEKCTPNFKKHPPIPSTSSRGIVRTVGMVSVATMDALISE